MKTKKYQAYKAKYFQLVKQYGEWSIEVATYNQEMLNSGKIPFSYLTWAHNEYKYGEIKL